MFTPTELLKQYVKEAFAHEGIPASDQRIRTWSDYRRELARNVLGMLRTASSSGPFDFLYAGLNDFWRWAVAHWRLERVPRVPGHGLVANHKG